MLGAGTIMNSFTHLNLPATFFPDANIVIIGNGILTVSAAWSCTHTDTYTQTNIHTDTM